MQAGARFLRFRKVKMEQKINKKTMQNKDQKRIGKYIQNISFGLGLGWILEGFGKVWRV